MIRSDRAEIASAQAQESLGRLYCLGIVVEAWSRVFCGKRWSRNPLAKPGGKVKGQKKYPKSPSTKRVYLIATDSSEVIP